MIKIIPKARKNKSILRSTFKVFITVIFLVISINLIMYFIAINSHIKLKSSDIKFYIEGADDASKGKVQVNWKYLAAIDAVKYKNDFSKINSEEIKVLANEFIDNSSQKNTTKNNKYRLKNIDEVLNDLQFDNKEKKKVYKYLNDLKYMGLISERLRPDSSYTQFINDISPNAVEVYHKYGIYPSIIIAQAILESGWGGSQLSTKGNNLFGIKADSNWNGKIINMNTSEFYDKNVVASFRMYDSKSESLIDHGEFLYKNKRYKENGVFNATYYIEQAKALENAGYSTKENKYGEKIYAELLINIIRQYNLQLIDSKVEMEQ